MEIIVQVENAGAIHVETGGGGRGPAGPMGPGITIEYLTLAEYTALTVEEQNNPQVWYMITDEA